MLDAQQISRSVPGRAKALREGLGEDEEESHDYGVGGCAFISAFISPDRLCDRFM